MKTLIIYDNEGYKISEQQGQPSPRVPVGVPYIYEEIPEGKRLIAPKIEGEIVPVVDVSVTPHKLILEDIPPTEIDLLEARTMDLELTIAELIAYI